MSTGHRSTGSHPAPALPMAWLGNAQCNSPHLHPRSWWCLLRRPTVGSLAGCRTVTPQLHPTHPSVPPHDRGLGCGLCPRTRVAAGSWGAQAAATAPSTQAAIPSEDGDRENPKPGQKAGAGGAWRKAAPPRVPALAPGREFGLCEHPCSRCPWQHRGVAPCR